MHDILKASDVIKFGMRGYKETIDYNWHGRMITIKYLLPRNEVLEIIGNIREMCTTPNGDFAREFLDFAVKLNIVLFYALIELPSNIDEVYKLLYHSDLYSVILSNANKNQVDSILLYFGIKGAA